MDSRLLCVAVSYTGTCTVYECPTLVDIFRFSGPHVRIWTFYFTLLPSAQGPVLTMMSGEQCFGSRVDLLCTHPDPLADPYKYLPQLIAWSESGTTIDFTDPANARLTPTRVNSTASTLSFNITEEDHRDRVILYTCFLVRNNANRDHDESEALVLDPPGE